MNLIKRINFWPALPIFILVSAAIASRLMADSAPNDETSAPADKPDHAACCEK